MMFSNLVRVSELGCKTPAKSCDKLQVTDSRPPSLSPPALETLSRSFQLSSHPYPRPACPQVGGVKALSNWRFDRSPLNEGVRVVIPAQRVGPQRRSLQPAVHGEPPCPKHIPVINLCLCMRIYNAGAVDELCERADLLLDADCSCVQLPLTHQGSSLTFAKSRLSRSLQLPRNMRVLSCVVRRGVLSSECCCAYGCGRRGGRGIDDASAPLHASNDTRTLGASDAPSTATRQGRSRLSAMKRPMAPTSSRGGLRGTGVPPHSCAAPVNEHL